MKDKTNKYYNTGTQLRCVDNDREYISMQAAADDLKIGYNTLAQKLSYADEVVVEGHHLVVTCRRPRRGRYAELCKPVRCIETGEVYPSSVAAAAKVGCNSSLIRTAALGAGRGRRARGFHWEYVADTTATAVETPTPQTEGGTYEHGGVKLRVNPNYVLTDLFGGSIGVAYVRIDVLTHTATVAEVDQALTSISKAEDAPPMEHWSYVTSQKLRGSSSEHAVVAALLPYSDARSAQKAIIALSKIFCNQLPEEISEFLKASRACSDGTAFAQGCKSMAEVWDKAVSMFRRDYLRFMLSAVRRGACARFNKAGQADVALDWFNTNVFTMPDLIFQQTFSSINPFKEKEN